MRWGEYPQGAGGGGVIENTCIETHARAGGAELKDANLPMFAI